MDGDDQARRNNRRSVEPGHMQKVDAQFVQLIREMKVRLEGTRIGMIFEQREIFGQRIEFIQVRLLADQQVFRVIALARKLVDDIANVRADSEISSSSDI